MTTAKKATPASDAAKIEKVSRARTKVAEAHVKLALAEGALAAAMRS